MSSMQGYLDQICRELNLDPAAAADLQDELLGHLEELAEWHQGNGADSESAVRCALASFGKPARLKTCLQVVHHGGSLWARRAKGAVLGMVVGFLFSLMRASAGQLGLLPQGMFASVEIPSIDYWIRISVIIVGGLIGLAKPGRGGPSMSWVVSAVAWLALCTTLWVLRTISSSIDPQDSMSVFCGVLLSPIPGGLFGTAAGLGSSVLLSTRLSLRPAIR